MKKLASAFAMTLGWATVAWAGAPAPLTTLHAVHALTNAEASKQQPVAFEAIVIYFLKRGNDMNVQEGDEAIFVRATTTLDLVPGDRVLIKGTTQPSYIPIVASDDITLLGHGALPTPVPASFDDLIRVPISCRLVRVRGIVRTTDVTITPTVGRIQLLMDGGYVELTVGIQDSIAFKALLDAEVEVVGAAGRIFDAKMQQTGAKVKVSSLADIKVLHRASASPWALPITPMSDIITGTHVRDLTQRLRVQGVITYFQPGTAAVLQNGTRSLWVSTWTNDPLQIGDEADATGFPDTRDGRLTLTRAEIQDRHTRASITALPSAWHQLAQWARNTPTGHQYDLVSIEGRVVTEVREASQDEYVLDSDGKLFTAIYRHPHPPRPSPPMLQVPLGSTIRVTGICLITDADAFNGLAPFDILLRSFDDVAIVARPSLLNIRNLTILVVFLLALVIAGSARGWALERKLRQKTAALATRIEAEAALERRSVLLEQKRSRILEDINGSQTLANILDKIAEMISFRLGGAPCWCEVADGSMAGDCPPQPHGLRVVRVNIEARSGPALGALFAALAPEMPPSDRETDALLNGARLATLAIEARRLYSDLRHRSEFDLLTDIHNRFSMNKRVDVLIQETGKNSGTFGLIYIDLDKFKPVNDLFGHHVGDVYLQEVAARMNDKLLGGDMLARLGGDEFAALVLLPRGRSDLNKIVARLEGCFDAPFVIEGNILKGSASIGMAIYPEDGATKDALLSAADAAMYVAKNIKREERKCAQEVKV